VRKRSPEAQAVRDQLDAGFKLYRENPPKGHAVFLDFDEYLAEQAGDEPQIVGVEDPEAIAMAMTIERPITGERANEFGYVVLQDGRALRRELHRLLHGRGEVVSEQRALTKARTNGSGQTMVIFGGVMIGLAWRGDPPELWHGVVAAIVGLMQTLWPWPWRRE